ncbi:MAG: hypothetical protein U1E91_01100 [Moraxella sp.]
MTKIIKAAITQTAPTQPQAAKEATSPLAVKVGNTLLLGYFIYEVKEIADDGDNKTILSAAHLVFKRLKWQKFIETHAQ